MLAVGHRPGRRGDRPRADLGRDRQRRPLRGGIPVFADVEAGQLVHRSRLGRRRDQPAHEGDHAGAPVRPSGAGRTRSRALAAAHGLRDHRGRRARDRRRAARPARRHVRRRRARSASRAPSCWSPARAACSSPTTTSSTSRAYMAVGSRRRPRARASGSTRLGFKYKMSERAGRDRARPAGARRRADRGEAPDLRLVRGGARRRRPASRSTTRPPGRAASTG